MRIISFIKEEWDDADGWFEKTLYLFIAACVIAGFLIIGYGIYWMLGGGGGHAEFGQIYKLEFVPGYIQYVDKTPIFIPDCWSVEFDDGSDWGHACVEKNVFDSLRVGENFNV